MNKEKRRGHHEGTIFENTRVKKDGSTYTYWQGQITLPTGQRKSVTGKTKRAVQLAMANLKRQIADGAYGSQEGQQTLGKWVEQWITNHYELGERTIHGYQSILKNHLKDSAGLIPLDDLTPAKLQSFYAEKSQGRAPGTIRNLHRLIHVALEEAVVHGIIPHNPSSAIRINKTMPKEMLTLRTEELEIFLRSASQNRLYALWVMALTTGMREGELLGLRWSDVDWQQRIIHIRQELYRMPGKYVISPPKSLTSIRDVPLADMTVMALQEWREYQKEAKSLCGNAWTTIYGDLVFTTGLGNPVDYGNLIRQLRRILKRANLNEKLRVHDLRHTFATLMLERGVHVLVVSKLLGHSSVEITLRIYGHVTRSMHQYARETVNQLLNDTPNQQIAESEPPVGILHNVLHNLTIQPHTKEEWDEE